MTKATVTRTPVNRCLACGMKIDAATPTPDFPDSATPGPGDIALCLDCAHIMIYADDLTLREPTGEEIFEIAGDPDIIRAVDAIGELKRREGR